MNIHEHQAKELLLQYQIPIPFGYVAYTEKEVGNIVDQFAGERVAVKAQIHAGGRGKAGGVLIADSKKEARDFAKNLLGTTLKTPQTGPQGQVVQRLLIEEICDIEKEYYLSMTVDRNSEQIVVIASESGGTSIEEIAKENPEHIIKEEIDISIGLMAFQARRMAFNLNLPEQLMNPFIKIMTNMYQLFYEKNCTTVEINPLVVTTDNTLIALDAKINFDDNALFKHSDIEMLRDISFEDEREIHANQYDLSYIALDGNIGCLVNGAGLAMATMDIIQYYGGNPANFLDVGGSATTEKVEEAFKIILSDTQVKGIFVNIFGGIMKCDVIAKGIVEATKKTGLSLPLIVRLEGTNVQEGEQILRTSGLNIIPAESMDDGAAQIVSSLMGETHK